MSIPETVIPDTVLQPIADTLGITLDDVKDIIKSGVTPTILLNKQEEYELQVPATGDVGNPQQNIWYRVFFDNLMIENILYDAEVVSIGISVATADESLQVRLTVDGVVLDVGASFAAAAGSNYSVIMYPSALTGNYATYISSVYSPAAGFSFKCRSLEVEFRKTTILGTGNMKIVVVYRKKVPG